jgi:hypothetical protein
MTQAGYAGNQRYLIIPTAAIAVLAGIGAARVIQGAALLARRRLGEGAARVAAVASLAVALAAAAPVIGFKLDNVTTIADSLEYEASLWTELEDAIGEAGGGESLLACGSLYSGAFQTQMIAYELHVKGIRISIFKTRPPGAIFRTRTAPGLGPVPAITSEGFRTVVNNRRWRILTAPRRGDSACPSARAG